MGLTVQIDGGQKDFEQIENLMQPGVLADIVDKGLIDNKFKPGTKVHKCYFVWIVEEEDSEGHNKRVFESFTVSLHKKSGLRKRYKELTGKSDAQVDALKTVDLEGELLGAKRFLILSKEDGENGKPFIKVQATTPLPKGNKGVDVPADFIRKVDRQD